MTKPPDLKPGASASIAFVACVESGYLENQTMLLCRSIRRYAGKYRDAPIYTFQPRRGTTIGNDTLAGLNELGVVHDTRPRRNRCVSRSSSRLSNARRDISR